MLPKNNRLTSRQDYAALKTAGRKYQSTSFALLYKENNLDINRFGFIVSKRVSLKATQRNLVKRRLREIFFKLTPRLLGSSDFLFLVKTEMVDKNMFETENEVMSLFSRLGLIK